MTHFFDPGGSVNTLNWLDHSEVLMTKRKEGIEYNNLPSSGDEFDAFANNTSMSMGTNPAPVNVVTYHHERPDAIGTISAFF